jgi:ACT domain-containing protein
MIVLDYLKKTAEDSVQIPAFHTGHLGLIPDTEVNVGLIATGRNDHHGELLITPYEPAVSDMAYIHCVMNDRPGVVQLLLEAVSLLDINIITQESSAINSLNHHSINLIIDWSSSSFSNGRESNPSQQTRYSEWNSLFPYGDARYIKLFESVIAHCGHLLISEESGRHDLPRILIRPLRVQNVRPKCLVKVERDPTHKFQVKIKLPPQILAPLHSRLRTQYGDPLSYVLLSETDDRVLRVFFPSPELIDRTVHLAFRHRDLPGALSTLTKLLAKESFNILTSLLRKISPQLSVWESILEYRGPREPSALPTGEPGKQYAWIAERLRNRAMQEALPIERYQFEVGMPLYPKRYEKLSARIRLTEAQPKEDEARPPVDIDEVLKSRVNEALTALANSKRAVPRALFAVSQGVAQKKRSVFFSFPKEAMSHAGLLEAAFEGTYVVRKYSAEGSEVITDAICEMIRSCEYFVGIWHHDETLPTGNGKFGISPWMPFEYGIASALQKPCLVIHSDRLDEKIWKRINPSMGNPEYKDLIFVKETIPNIVERFRRLFP